MTAVEWLQSGLELIMSHEEQMQSIGLFEQAKEMEKEQMISLLKSLVYSVCMGDDVEDVEEWLKEHELNKSE